MDALEFTATESATGCAGDGVEDGYYPEPTPESPRRWWIVEYTSGHIRQGELRTARVYGAEPNRSMPNVRAGQRC